MMSVDRFFTFSYFSFNSWQRFMTSCVPEGRNLTCCLSSQSLPPQLSLDYHQVEAYRASKTQYVLMCVCVCINQEPTDTMFLLCYRRNCIISAYYQQRETHKPTLPNVSRAYTSYCNHVWRPFSFTMYNLLTITLTLYPCYLSVQGLGGSWEALLDFLQGSTDCN